MHTPDDFFEMRLASYAAEHFHDEFFDAGARPGDPASWEKASRSVLARIPVPFAGALMVRRYHEFLPLHPHCFGLLSNWQMSELGERPRWHGILPAWPAGALCGWCRSEALVRDTQPMMYRDPARPRPHLVSAEQMRRIDALIAAATSLEIWMDSPSDLQNQLIIQDCRAECSAALRALGVRPPGERDAAPAS